jgi:hypothetical protein
MKAKSKGRFKLVFTSSPFPRKTKKKYDNLQGEEYVRGNLRPRTG